MNRTSACASLVFLATFCGIAIAGEEQAGIDSRPMRVASGVVSLTDLRSELLDFASEQRVYPLSPEDARSRQLEFVVPGYPPVIGELDHSAEMLDGGVAAYGNLPGHEHGTFGIAIYDGALRGYLRAWGQEFAIIGDAATSAIGMQVVYERVSLENWSCDMDELSQEFIGRSVQPNPQRGTGPLIVDLLIIYSPQWRIDRGGSSAATAAVLSQVAWVNQAHSNSLTGIELNLVYAYETAPDGGSGQSSTLQFNSALNLTDGIVDELRMVQDQVKADLVHFLYSGNGGGVAQGGVAGTTTESGVSVGGTRDTSSGTSGSLTGHETGHNFGLAHACETTGFRSYGRGYKNNVDGDPQNELTLLGLNNACGSSGGSGSELIQYYSNPNITLPGESVPLGVPIGNPDEADATAAMILDGPTVASNRTGSADLTDCQSNGLLDSIEFFYGMSLDQGGDSGSPNGVPDSCDRTAWAGDCGNMALSDSSLVSWHVELDRTELGRFGGSKTIAFHGIPDPGGDLTITVNAKGAFQSPSAFLDVYINGSLEATLFETTGVSCTGASINTDDFIVNESSLNLGPDQELIIDLVPTGTGLCQSGSGTSSVTVSYLSRLAENLDRDDILDACDPSCNIADNSVPFGTLDFTDVSTFLTWYGDLDDRADLEVPLGQWDISDVNLFLAAHAAGCP